MYTAGKNRGKLKEQRKERNGNIFVSVYLMMISVSIPYNSVRCMDYKEREGERVRNGIQDVKKGGK
jgi:hypothetical protein